MDAPILQILARLREQHLDALPLPAQHARVDGQGHAIDAIQQVLATPHGLSLLALALGPRVRRPEVARLDDVDEARVHHVRAPVARVAQVRSDRSQPGDDVRLPLVQGGAREGTVVAAHGHAGVLQLIVAAGGERGEDVGDHRAIILEAAEEGAAVDEVKFLTERPWFFGVVDLEAAVGWGAARHGMREME